MSDWLDNGLPTYDGEKDRSLVRSMIDRLGGPKGFKTAYSTNPDGSVTTVQLKGDMPPQVDTTEPVVATPPVSTNRGFVFTREGDATSIVASQFNIVRTDFVGVINPTYTVAPCRTDRSVLWNDVWRLDGTQFMENGQVPSGDHDLPSVIPSEWRRTAPFPWVEQRSLRIGGKYVQTVLIPGGSYTTNAMKVSTISADGVETAHVDIDTTSETGFQPVPFSTDIDAGIFTFKWRYLNSGYDAWMCGHAKATAINLLVLEHEVYSTESTLDVENFEEQSTSTAHYEDITIEGEYGPELWYRYSFPCRVITENEDSDVIVCLKETSTRSLRNSPESVAEIDFTWEQTTVDDSEWSDGLSYYRGPVGPLGAARPQIITSERIVGKKIRTVSKSASYSVEPLIRATTTEEQTTTVVPAFGGPSTLSMTSVGQSRAYLFHDENEEISIWLEADLNQTFFGNTNTQEVGTFEGTLTLQYVLDVRGIHYNFVIAYGTTVEDFIELIDTMPGLTAFDYPAYTNQGNCPFIAYTTKSEEAAGASPEIYVDASASIANFYANLFWLEGDGFEALVTQIANTRVQFANGICGPWAERLGYPAGTILEISRI